MVQHRQSLARSNLPVRADANCLSVTFWQLQGEAKGERGTKQMAVKTASQNRIMI
jgi:hypothetical protein